MGRELLEKIIKGFSLIPLKYHLGGAAGIIVLLIYSIWRTFSAPTVVLAPVAGLDRKEARSFVEQRQPAAIPPAVWEENLFRRQRKNFAPPPPAPAPPAAAQKPVEEPVPDIKLLGLILTDSRRLAIVDAELKRYIRKEIPEQLVISGLKQAGPVADDGRYYEIVAVKGDKLASQTFNEGDVISDYRLEKVNDNSIEVVSLASGKRTVLFLEEADAAAKGLEQRLAKEKPHLLRDVPNTGLSGAKQ